MTRSFKKILVANRGEIAVRILRALRELQIPSVAIYSDADKKSYHLKFAGEVRHIGKSRATESYLCGERIIETAKRVGADAIHPGYGFLAENSAFAKSCEEQGLTFIGPQWHAIRLLGDKTTARKTVRARNIPTVPGTEDCCDDLPAVKAFAADIGYPILIKAAGGGGGKGMRVAASEADLVLLLKLASDEARSTFGDPRVYLEKYLPAPRHIEIQVAADVHGNVVHLFERECSIQRRHQKMLEESPSAFLTPELRQQMGQIACEVVKASGYTNVGTVEFLVDSQRKFYFLEVNTRLQVEHPVTELVTGIDLVKLQLLIAAGQPLPFSQEDLRMRGSAIECRISAEDPANNFAPSIGVIEELFEPSGPGVRLDSGVCKGSEISMYYDPLMAKLLVWAPSRMEAIATMQRALGEYLIGGIKTTIPFHQRILADSRFREGSYTTRFLDILPPELEISQEHRVVAALAALIIKEKSVPCVKSDSGKTQKQNPWKIAGRREAMRS